MNKKANLNLDSAPATPAAMAGQSENTQRRRVRFSLGLRLSLGLTLTVGLLFAGLNTFNLLSARKSRRTDALAKNEALAQLIASSIVDELSTSELRSERVRAAFLTFVRAVVDGRRNKRSQDLAYVLIVDNQGELVTGRVKTKFVNLPLANKNNPQNENEMLLEIARLNGRLGAHMRVKRFPFQINGVVVGKMLVGTSLAKLEASIRRDLLLNLGVFAGLLIFMIVYSSWVLRMLVTRPLTLVSESMDAVQDGHYDRAITLPRNDEIGVLADSYNFMRLGLKEREKLQDAFNRYVSPQVYEKFAAGEIRLEGESRNATILFSDIRSFTSISEQLTPGEVVSMLNEYFSAMVDVVFKYDGFINKFIGDAIMAVYNAPLEQGHHELRAVQTALDMMASLNQLNITRAQRGEPPIHIGIGINTGPVIAGNIGHQQRLEYTVIGDAVNLASRIESQTKAAGAPVLISEYTYRPIAQFLEVTALEPVKVKGKEQAVALYAVHGLRARG